MPQLRRLLVVIAIPAAGLLAPMVVEGQPLGVSAINALGGPSAPDWRAVYGPGRLPSHERLLVVAADGRIVRVVEGYDRHVTLPMDLHLALVDGGLRATLVHNHPADRGFSCADLRQLDKPGVEAVVVVGSGGSVFEAAAGAHYDVGMLQDPVCGRLMSDVALELAAELGHGFDDRSELADQVPHLLTAALARAGVVTYRHTAAIQSAIVAFRNTLAFDRVVGRMANQLARRVAGVTVSRTR